MHCDSKLYFIINRCNVTLEKTMICEIIDKNQLTCYIETCTVYFWKYTPWNVLRSVTTLSLRPRCWSSSRYRPDTRGQPSHQAGQSPHLAGGQPVSGGRSGRHHCHQRPQLTSRSASSPPLIQTDLFWLIWNPAKINSSRWLLSCGNNRGKKELFCVNACKHVRVQFKIIFLPR